jgi:putative flippase GtrA
VTRQLARYLVVGASNTAITLAVYAVLVRAGAPAVGASVAAFWAGALNGFRLNRRWTFRSDRRGLRTGGRYVLVQLLGVGLNALGVAFAVGVAEVPKLAGDLAALPPVTAATFVLSRTWVFGPGDGRPGPRRAVPRLR